MADVIDLHPRPRAGDQVFITCGCTPEPTAMLPVALAGDAPFIALLVCPACETEVPVVNGYLMIPQPES